jgi:hypothetical protein
MMAHQQSITNPTRYLETDEAQNLVSVYIRSGEQKGSRIDINVSLTYL